MHQAARRLVRAGVFVDRLAGDAIGSGRQGCEAALIDGLAAVQALPVAAVLDALLRNQHLLQLVRGVVGLDLVDGVA